MKCEKCGAEIKPGQLLCPKCGWEVQMVPEFESVVDMAVQDVMGHIAGNVIKTQELEEEELRSEESEERNYKMHLHSTVLTAAVIAVVALIIILKAMNTAKPDPMEKAAQAMEKGSYAEAAKLYKDYVNEHPGDEETLLLLAECYRRTGMQEDAVSIYEGFSFDREDENAATACRALTDIYIEQENFHEAGKILSYKAAAAFVDSYLEYAALTPEFSVAQDTYDQPIYVKILYDGKGDVYYTLDGSSPDAASESYSDPILLDGGIYTLKAVSINPHGVMSSVATSVYEILTEEEEEEALARTPEPVPELAISREEAIALLTSALVNKGIILNGLGGVFGKYGQNLYIHKEIITINSDYYYLVEEFYKDPVAEPVKTGNLYCVDAMNGSVYRADLNGEGNYFVVSL